MKFRLKSPTRLRWAVLLTFLIILYVYNILTINLSKNTYNLSKILIKDNCVKHALFSPKDDIRKYIIELIKNEQKGIKGAIYSFSDKHIMQELINAKKRNVQVDIVLDPSNMLDRSDKIFSMHKNNLDLYIFNIPILVQKKKRSKKSCLPLMHNKFIIFEKNINNKPILVTGSFNWTYSANELNCENVVILDDTLILDLYNNEFSNIKKNSIPLENCKKYFQKKIKLNNQDTNKIRDFNISKL